MSYGFTAPSNYRNLIALSVNPSRASVFQYKINGSTRIAKFTPDLKEAAHTTNNARLAHAGGQLTPEHYFRQFRREELPAEITNLYNQKKISVIDMNRLDDCISLPEYLASANEENKAKIVHHILHDTIPFNIGGMGYLDLNPTNIFVPANNEIENGVYVIDMNCAIVGMHEQNRPTELEDPSSLMTMYYKGDDIHPQIEKRVNDLMSLLDASKQTICTKTIQENMTRHQEILSSNKEALAAKGLEPYVDVINKRLEQTKRYFS